MKDHKCFYKTKLFAYQISALTLIVLKACLIFVDLLFIFNGNKDVDENQNPKYLKITKN